MAVSGAKTGRALVRVGRGATPTWTEMKGAGYITAPDGTVEDIEVTSQSSPKGEKEFIPGRVDRGSMSFTLDYVEGQPTDVCLKAIKLSQEIVQLEITLDRDDNDSEAEVFAAYLKSYKRTTPVNGQQKAEVEFKIAGLVA